MANETRWVVLDGSSSAFEFSGEWVAESDNSMHLSSLYTTTQNGSDMKFTFSGPEMILFGKVTTGTGGRRPTVGCTVDGTPTNPDDRATGENFACSWKGEGGSGTHTFLLNVTIPAGSGSPSPSASIDSLWFQPAPDFSLSDKEALVMYDNNDPHIDFSGNWEPLTDPDGAASVATQAGSSMSVVFTGTAVIWEGWRPVGFGTGRSSGTYSIDGATPVTFNLDPPDPSDSNSVHGIKFIEVKDLPSGAHNLTVVYNGPSTPLVLDHLYVGGGNFRIEERPTAPSQSTTTPILPSTSASNSPSSSPGLSSPSPGASAPSTPSTSSPASSSSPRGSPTGAIVGGVVGGLAVVLLAVLIFIWTRRRSKKQNIAEQMTPSTTHLGLTNSPPVSAATATWATANGTSPTLSYEANLFGAHSPNIYRKGQESVPVARAEASGGDVMEESHRHQD
ncbi:hypothetical protein BKA70DRAFT_1405054, partial [Coprinopsis sp. MPI-PUGE-AT-0042]